MIKIISKALVLAYIIFLFMNPAYLTLTGFIFLYIIVFYNII